MIELIDRLQSWREMIANGAVNDVLIEMLETGVKDEDEIILLSSQYERYRSAKISGTLSNSEVEKIRNNIESNVLEFIDKQKEKIKNSKKNNVDSKETKIEFSITINAKFSKDDQPKINAIIHKLMNVTSDYSIQLTGIESGSIKIFLLTEKSTYKKILNLFDKQKLDQIINAEIIGVNEAKFSPPNVVKEKNWQSSIGNSPTTEKSNDDKSNKKTFFVRGGLTGTVKYFNASKGFGFVIDHASGEELFVHISDLTDDIREGDIISFDRKTDSKGSVIAVNIRPSK